MKIQSNLKPRPYTEKEVCRIVNPKQYNLYMKHRVFPIDIYPSIGPDQKDGGYLYEQGLHLLRYRLCVHRRQKRGGPERGRGGPLPRHD